MSNMNFDENSINKIKDMMNKGELNDVISQIPPDMLKNFSSMMSNSTNDNSTNEKNSNEGSSNSSESSDSNSNPMNNFDFSNIDMNTILKMKTAMESLNGSKDPRSNLLYSLKPYLRDEKKQKVDQYANLLNITKIAEVFNKDGNKENKENKDNNG